MPWIQMLWTFPMYLFFHIKHCHFGDAVKRKQMIHSKDHKNSSISTVIKSLYLPAAVEWSNLKFAINFTLSFCFLAFQLMQNEAPTGVAYTAQNQSVAAFVAADKVAFYHCAFYSTHNSLFDYKGRHYYDNCYIQGSIDFIFGRGRSVFHVINLISYPLSPLLYLLILIDNLYKLLIRSCRAVRSL